MAFLTLALALIGPRWLAPWLRLSADIASGYSVAASILGAPSQVAVGLAVVLAVLAATVLVRRHSPHLVLGVLCVLPLLIQFRLAFVRQDGHELQLARGSTIAGEEVVDEDVEELRSVLSGWPAYAR